MVTNGKVIGAWSGSLTSICLPTIERFVLYACCLPIPVVVGCQAYFRGRSIPGISISNPTEVMAVCLFCWCGAVSGLCDELFTRPEESYRMYIFLRFAIQKPRQWGSLWDLAPDKIYIYRYLLDNHRDKFTVRRCLVVLPQFKNLLLRFTAVFIPL